MADYTDYLGLIKPDPVADGVQVFNLDTYLNENWDKVDAAFAQARKTVMSPTMPPDLRPGDTWLEVISSAATGDRRVSMATIPTVNISVRQPESGQPLYFVATLLSDAADGDVLKLRRYRRRGGSAGMSRAGFVIPNPHRRPNHPDGQYSFWLGDTGLPLEWNLSGQKAGDTRWLFPVNMFKEIRQFARVYKRGGPRDDYCFMGGGLNEDMEPSPNGTGQRFRRTLIDFIVQRGNQFGAPSNTTGVSFVSNEAGFAHEGDEPRDPGEPRVIFK